MYAEKAKQRTNKKFQRICSEKTLLQEVNLPMYLDYFGGLWFFAAYFSEADSRVLVKLGREHSKV